VAFSVEDFQGLLRLLEQHPEWRAELRRQVLSDELLEMPAILRQLAQAQARTEQRLEALTERVDALAQAQARTEQRLEALTERVDALAQAQARTEQRLEALTERVDALAQAQTRTEQRLAEVAAAVESLSSRVGDLTGDVLELRYWRRAHAYFSRLARRLRVVDSSQLADMLDDAVDSGQITDTERNLVLEADLVLSGKRRDDRADAYFVVEVSRGIGVGDVTRAAERASILSKLGRPAVGVVAGQSINTEAVKAADSYNVWQVLDGRTAAPSEN
jgi:chaperonin cofactor prefoldin